MLMRSLPQAQGVPKNPQHNGSDCSSMLEFIEKKYEENDLELRKLIMQGKAEKVNKHYKIKQTSVAIKPPPLQQKVVTAKPRPMPRSCFTANKVQDATKTSILLLLKL
ncbi:hypothetical protein ACS0TY_022556 [Phlomoides rotata]